MDSWFFKGIQLFNSRKFFEAHEALEEVWLKAQGEEKALLHGLIQIAAAFHHHTRGNLSGFRSLLEKGLRKLERLGAWANGVDLAGLRRQLQPWRDISSDPHFTTAQKAPPIPRIRMISRP